jgi:hypothetical protein
VRWIVLYTIHEIRSRYLMQCAKRRTAIRSNIGLQSATVELCWVGGRWILHRETASSFALLGTVDMIRSSILTSIELGLGLLQALTGASFAADIFVSPSGVDSSPGTRSDPVRTISRAAELVRAGQTVHVAPGIYAEAVHSRASGTAIERIRYVSDVRWGAKLRPAASSAEAIWWNAGSFVDIDGFEVDGSVSPSARIGIYSRGNQISIANNLVHHIYLTAPCDDHGGGGIMAGGSYYNESDEHIIGNVVYKITANNNCNFVHGIYHQTSGSVVNNMCYLAGEHGIVLWHDAHDVLIANNTVFANVTGIGVGSGDFYQAPRPADNVLVINNISAYNSKYGFLENGLVGTGNIYASNISFGNPNDFQLISGRLLNNIYTDPEFVRYTPDGGGDYHLKSSSPAIDRGVIERAPATDIDGRPRIGAPDIGAYEFVPGLAQELASSPADARTIPPVR